jgi:4-alpha-glucanotransferase
MSPADLGAWGIDPGYHDYAGNWRAIPDETVRQVLEAMGAETPAPGGHRPLVTTGRHGPWPEVGPGQLHLENGATVEVPAPAQFPPELDLGYHRFVPADGGEPTTVAVCPDQCPAPPPGRTWGWAVQLYAARSAGSWGIGDFADLRRLAKWAGDNGAGFVLVNPLHAPGPGPDPGPSPYSPSSRCFLNPLYIRVEEVPGAAALPDVAHLAEKGRALNQERKVDRAAVWALKSDALEALFQVFEKGSGDARFDAYVAGKGPSLDGYTTFCALAERYGLPWQEWPEHFRHPAGPAVAEFVADEEARSRKRYYAWLQWLCELQLASVAGRAGVMCDLAVGVDSGGADTWLWQGVFDLGMRVGAPPDEFNTKGQDWGLPPLDPWKLRASGYQIYIETLRSALRYSRGLRVDHVMGLFRLYWVPVGNDAEAGAYVRYVWQDMVALLRLEAWRAGAYVVGEDLGTVEDHVRDVLGESGVLSYKLFWFEPQPPGSWPHQALGAVTTHDLPTVAGVWTGADVAAQRALGLPVNEEACSGLRDRILHWTGCDGSAPVGEVVEATYASLGRAPCALLSAVLEDACAVEERPNMPGTIDEWPNWCLALPLSLEEIEQSPLAAAIARSLNPQ